MAIQCQAVIQVKRSCTHYAGSDRVQNVIIRGSTVQPANRNKVEVFQNITWDAPSNHHNIHHYLIKYQMQGQPTSSETRTSSNATQATLELLVLRGKTSTYSVRVAAVSEAGQGEFSERMDFNYSRKSTLMLCIQHTFVTQWYTYSY